MRDRWGAKPPLQYRPEPLREFPIESDPHHKVRRMNAEISCAWQDQATKSPKWIQPAVSLRANLVVVRAIGGQSAQAAVERYQSVGGPFGPPTTVPGSNCAAVAPASTEIRGPSRFDAPSLDLDPPTRACQDLWAQEGSCPIRCLHADDAEEQSQIGRRYLVSPVADVRLPKFHRNHAIEQS